MGALGFGGGAGGQRASRVCSFVFYFIVTITKIKSQNQQPSSMLWELVWDLILEVASTLPLILVFSY